MLKLIFRVEWRAEIDNWDCYVTNIATKSLKKFSAHVDAQ